MYDVYMCVMLLCMSCCSRGAYGVCVRVRCARGVYDLCFKLGVDVRLMVCMIFSIVRCTSSCSYDFDFVV